MRVVHYTLSIGCPSQVNGREGRRVVAEFYAGLLGMRVIREGWLKIAKEVELLPHLAFSGDGWSDVRPPRWPDPEFPQQVHLDFHVNDLDGLETRVVQLGGSKLDDRGEYRIYSDPVGHPFCACPAPHPVAEPAVIWRVVFDCFSPSRSQASTSNSSMSGSESKTLLRASSCRHSLATSRCLRSSTVSRPLRGGPTMHTQHSFISTSASTMRTRLNSLEDWARSI